MSRNTKRNNILLWIAQSLLCLLFLFAGGMKLVAPLAELQRGPIHLPGGFLRFIGVMELLGGLGLVLPGIFRIHLYLTPLAAAGLATIMIGATVVSFAAMGAVAAIIPFVVGIIAVLICRGRGGIGLRPGRSGTPALASRAR